MPQDNTRATNSSQITIVHNEKIRIKLTDACNMNCWFCHSEGAKGSSDIVINGKLKETLSFFRNYYSKVHITGGEPFLYTSLSDIVDLLISTGYIVALTSNGYYEIDEKKKRILEKLSYVNISFHSINPAYYDLLTKTSSGNMFVDRISTNILTMKEILPVRINAVVSEYSSVQCLESLLFFAKQNKCELKLVPELQSKVVAQKKIDEFLAKNKFLLKERIIIQPSSNYRERFVDNDEFVVEVKKLIPCFPNSLCGNCTQLDKCEEGFSFLRIGGNPLYCQACIKKPPILFDEFMETWGQLNEELLNTKNEDILF